MCKYALPSVVLLYKNICRSLDRSEILPHEFPFARSQRRHDCSVFVDTDSYVIVLHFLVGQSTGFDHFEKTRFVDDAPIWINDDPVISEPRAISRAGRAKFWFRRSRMRCRGHDRDKLVGRGIALLVELLQPTDRAC